MTKVNIREALNQMDKDTDCKYDLVTLYESCLLTEEDKKDIAKSIADKEDADVIYDKLVDKYGDDVSVDDDDINDLKFINENTEVIYQKGNKKIVKDGYGYAIDDGINANRFYVTEDGKPKFEDGCSSKFWLDKVNSLIKAGKLTSRKNESKSIKESNYGGDDYGFDEYDFIDHYDDLEEGILNPYDNIIDEIIMDNVDKIKQGWLFDDFFNKVLEDFKKIAQPEDDDIEILKDKAYKQYNSIKRLYDKNEAFEKDGGPFWYFTKHGVQPGSVPKDIDIIEIKDTPNGTFFSSNKVITTKELKDFEITEKKPETVNEHYYSSAEEFKKELTDDLIKKAFTPEQAEWLVNKRPTDAEWLAYGNAETDDFEYFISYTNKHLNEDTVKTSKGKWVNKGKEGTHGTFDTKKEADAQRKAMFASGYKGESLNEGLSPQKGDRVRMDHYSKLNNGQEGTVTGRIGELCSVTWDDGTKSKEIKGYLTVIERDGKVVNESTTELVEDSEETDDLISAEQEFDSAATSINSSKLPAVYNMVKFNTGDVVVDFGGGKFDNAVNYLKDQDVTLLVYDPYNRSAEHNKDVIRVLKEHGGADAAVNSNVLNVIKEPEARNAVLQNIKKITKKGAPIYITVYEGTGKGNEGPTKSGYQLNRKTSDYMDEISQVFSNVTRKGKLITAMNESATDPRYYKMIEYNYDGDDIFDYLGHVRVRTNSDKVALRAAEKYAMSKHPEDNPRHFKIVDDNYTNVDVIDSDGDYLTTLESVDESKSINESSLVDKKVSTLGKRGKPMYFTAAQLKDAKEKYPEYDFEETTIEYSLPAGQKAYIAKKKTNESKSIKESTSGPKYVTRDIVNKTNSQKLKDAYDEGELEVLINGDVWYTERCPKGLGKELKAEMKRLYPNIRHLYGESVSESLKDSLTESANDGGHLTINFGYWVDSKSFQNKQSLLKFLRSHIISSSSVITLAKNVTDDYENSIWYDTAENVRKFNLTDEQRREIFEKGYTLIDNHLEEMESESLIEASYGGAYDIADDQYFTKEDGMIAANEVEYKLEKEFPEAKLEVIDMQLDNHSFYVALIDKDGNEFTEEITLDMRKIRHPLDLIKKYAPALTERFIKQIKDYYSEI